MCALFADSGTIQSSLFREARDVGGLERDSSAATGVPGLVWGAVFTPDLGVAWTSKRGTSFDLFGDVSLESVRRSNVHLSRAAILVLVCIAREVWYAIEQPGSSRLPRLPFFDGLLKDDLIPTIFQRLSWPHLSVSLELMVLFM